MDIIVVLQRKQQPSTSAPVPVAKAKKCAAAPATDRLHRIVAFLDLCAQTQAQGFHVRVVGGPAAEAARGHQYVGGHHARAEHTCRESKYSLRIQ